MDDGQGRSRRSAADRNGGQVVLRGVVVVAVALVAAPARAGETEIVVTALPRPAGDRAYDIVTIDRERLATSASGRIEDILGQVAGFQQFRRTDSRAANPTSQGATLRAIGGNASSRALVLLDGAPVADPFAGYIPWFALTPERLASARVTRGAGAGAFGAGALAGTIELDSVDPATLPAFAAALDYGSFDAVSASASAAMARDGGGAALFGRYDRGDGYVLVPDAQRGPADVPARYAQASVGVRVALPLSPDVALGLDALGFDDRRRRGIAGNESRIRGASTSVRLTGGTAWRFDALAYLQAQTFANDVVALDAARTAATPTLSQYNTPATGYGGKIELRPPLPRGGEVRLGVDFRHEDGTTREKSRYIVDRYTRLREAGGRNTSVGGYAEASLTAIPRLTLTVGARVDRWRIGGGFLDERDAATGAPTIALRPRDRDKVEPTARGGVAYQLGNGIALRGAAYRGYRLPTLNELYRAFRVGADATAANSGLAPERLRGVEAGVDLAVPGADFAVTAFHNRVANAIANVSVASGPGIFPEVGFVAAGGIFRRRTNLDAIVARGIEVEAHVRRGALRLDASYAYTRSRIAAAGSPLDGLPPAQTPAHQGSATLGWARAGASAAVTARYAGAQFDDDLGVRRLASATTLDAVVMLPIHPALSLIFRGENLTGTLVESGISSSGVIDRGTPRTLWAGVRFRTR